MSRVITLVFIFVVFIKINCFSQQNELKRWTNYQTIMWVGDSANKNKDKLLLFFSRLKEMGITAVSLQSWQDPINVLTNNLNYYVENIINRGLCLKWNSSVRDWDKFIRGWMTSRSESAFIRDYCLDDPKWRNWATEEMKKVVKKHSPHNPLAHNIRDELSMTISANPFDYDYNPIALKSFRNWLKENYGSLEKLNNEWETDFKNWDEVMPFSTDLIKNRMASGLAKPTGKPDWQALQRLKFNPKNAVNDRTRWNFSPWCDFRTYMDISLASALSDIRKAANEIDAITPVGIEGTQMPHPFGGYDLWRLSKALDWVEPYDIGNAREIFGSFMGNKLILTTVFEKESLPAFRRLCHLLLSGDRGCIIWWSEDCIDWKNPDLPLTQKAKALAPVLKELTSPLAKIFLKAKPERDSIAIYYSQPSIQVDWLFESTVDGSTWVRRYSSYEASHNRMATVRNSWLKIFQDLGFNPSFISPEQILSGGIDEKTKLLILPTALAMSDKEIGKILVFINAGKTTPNLVFSDGTPGLFDEHGKLRASYPLEKYFPAANSSETTYCVAAGRNYYSLQGDIAKYSVSRLKNPPSFEQVQWVKKILEQSNIKNDISYPLEARAHIFKYKLSDAKLIAFERGIDYQMSEDLKQAGGNESLEVPQEITTQLSYTGHIYDLRNQRYIGYGDKITFTLDPWKPSLFVILNKKIAPETIITYLLSAEN